MLFLCVAASVCEYADDQSKNFATSPEDGHDVQGLIDCLFGSHALFM